MNKKVLTVLMAVILTAGYAQAQLAFGARAGLNFTNIYGDGADDEKMKPGFQLGVVAEYALSDAFAIQPGLLFLQQGSKLKEAGAVIKITLNYIQIPINAQYKIDFGFAGLLLQAGPYLGIGLGGKYKWDIDGLGDGDVKIKFGEERDGKDEIGDAYADLVYVDRNVTLTGTYKESGDTQHFNCNLKKGWNYGECLSGRRQR